MQAIPARRPTIKDVAARAGVSKSLASRAIRGDGRVSAESAATILKAAEELSYRPNVAARNLVQNRSRTIGIVILDLHNPISAELMDTIQGELRLRGWHTMIVTGSDDPSIEKAEVNKLIDFRVEGVIVVGHRVPSGLADVLSPRCPGVLACGTQRGVPFLDSVSNDDFAGARMAVDHLVSLGHKDIVHITGGDNDVAQLRRDGYLAGMRAHRLKSRAVCLPGGFTDEQGYQGALRAIDRSTRPTALFVANDFAAVGALAAIKERDIEVPLGIAIVGYDGISIGGLRPLSITTVAQPLMALGSLATELLVARIDAPDRPVQHLEVLPHLIVRNTTQPLESRPLA